MAKRFIDTEIFNDPWFMDLSKDAKIIWFYLITQCDHAGIFKVNERLLIFQTGTKGLATVSKELGNRLVTLSEELIFMPKFITFQYPKGLNTNVKAQKSVIDILMKHGLWSDENQTVTKELAKSYLTPQDKDKDKDKDTEKTQEAFLEAYKIYPGSKSKTDNFKTFKKHKDWKECLPLLKPAVEKEVGHKEALKYYGEFCPDFKNFKTWLNQRCWEQEFTAREMPKEEEDDGLF